MTMSVGVIQRVGLIVVVEGTDRYDIAKNGDIVPLYLYLHGVEVV